MAIETVPAVAAECSWIDIPCNATAAFSWVWDALNFIPRRVWSGVLDGLATVVEAVPVPSFMANLGTDAAAFAAVDGVVFWADLVKLPYALGIIGSAMLARFLFSLIPVIGK